MVCHVKDFFLEKKTNTTTLQRSETQIFMFVQISVLLKPNSNTI